MHDLGALLGPKRATSTAALTSVADAGTVSRWIRSGRLVRLHPGCVTLPELADDWILRAHAATGYTGGALSHMSALAVHGVVDNYVTRLDVTVPMDRRVHTSRWLRIHRTARPCAVVHVAELPATTVPRALVDPWGAAHADRAVPTFAEVARAAVLRATREGRASVPVMVPELASRPELPGRAALSEMLDLIRGGCQSELEILGCARCSTCPACRRRSSSTGSGSATVRSSASTPPGRTPG